MVNRTLFFFLFISLCAAIFSFIKDDRKENVKQKVIRTIFVDAGHSIMANGGHNGAKGSYSFEDDICPAVSKEPVKNFQHKMPEIKIAILRIFLQHESIMIYNPLT